VDLTQDDTDDDEKMKTWYDDNRDVIDHGYRSSYENKYDTSSPISDVSYRKPGNFVVTEAIAIYAKGINYIRLFTRSDDIAPARNTSYDAGFVPRAPRVIVEQGES
jgi:hypothetical protein